MGWITVKTTGTYWEAELMLQLLVAHQVPARVVPYGVLSQFGCGTPAALQVHPQDQWTAFLLLSPVDEELSDNQLADHGFADNQD